MPACNRKGRACYTARLLPAACLLRRLIRVSSVDWQMLSEFERLTAASLATPIMCGNMPPAGGAPQKSPQHVVLAAEASEPCDVARHEYSQTGPLPE